MTRFMFPKDQHLGSIKSELDEGDFIVFCKSIVRCDADLTGVLTAGTESKRQVGEIFIIGKGLTQ